MRQRAFARAARIQSRRRNRAVAAPPARRGVRGIQDVKLHRLALRAHPAPVGEPAGIGPDLCIDDRCARAWPCDLVVAGDIEVLRARAQQLQQRSDLPALRRLHGARAEHRAGTLRVLHRARRRASSRRASSIAPTHATCCSCSIAPSMAACAASSMRWSRRRCRRASSTTPASRSPVTPNIWPNAPAARIR